MSYTQGRKINRVLIVSEHFPPSCVNGMATYTYNLSKYLVKIGWEVYLVTLPSSTEAKARWYSQDGINIYRLGIPNIFTKEILFSRSFSIYLLKQMRNIIIQLRPDIIHFTSGWCSLMVTKFLRFNHIPIVLTIHNLPPAGFRLNIIRNDKINKLLELLYFKTVKTLVNLELRFWRYNRIIAVSEATANKIAKEGVSPNKICIIPNGVDILHFSSEKQEAKQPNIQHVVLTVGGIIEHKGQLNIIKSAPEVIAKFPEVVFLLVGPIRSGYYFNLLQETIKELRLEQNVKVTGAVSQEDLLSYYQICDLYLQPSLEEGFCITMLEAMACGKPVIGAPVGAIPKLIGDSKAGILISDSSPAEISRAAIKLLASEEMRREFGQRAREHVADKYSWEAVARQTASLYHEMITEKAKL